MNRKIYISESFDIYTNLATEAFLLNGLKQDEQLLFLWRNSPVVVIGRNQNPFAECDLKRMERDGVLLSRRFSGGGAVYHDTGNLCYTFISPLEHHDKDKNLNTVINALSKLGIKACQSGRNDIMSDNFKISGNAFQITKDKACHHGTILVSCDMSCIGDYLTPDRAKLDAHGVRSVSSRVRNISDIVPGITVDNVIEALAEEFIKSDTSPCTRMSIGPEISKDPYLEETRRLLSSRQWNYGRTLRFSESLSGRNRYGSFTFNIVTDKAMIKEIQVFSDALDAEGISHIEKAATGLPYFQNDIKQAAANCGDPFVSEALSTLADLI